MSRVKKEFVRIRAYLTEFLNSDTSKYGNITHEEKWKIYEPFLEFLYEKLHNK